MVRTRPSSASRRGRRLRGNSSPVAGSVEIHQSGVENGVMQMRALNQGVALPAGKTVSFEPGAMHLMLFELHAPLVAGKQVPLLLTFKRAGQVLTQLQVEPREPPPASAHEHHDHQH